MSEILYQPVTDRSAWRARDLVQDRSWVVHLTTGQSAELEDAARKLLARGRRAHGFDAADFALGETGGLLDAVREEVLRGRGVVLMRGLPVPGRERELVRAMYWGLGLRLGTAVTQNLQGDLIGEIADRGLDVNSLNVKPSLTNAEQRPHTDPGDIVTLLCINRAPSGGVSRIASTMALYNAVLAEHPEWLEWLYRGFHHDLRGDASPEAPYGCTPKPIPVYRYYEGTLSCVFNASTIKDAQRRMGALVPDAEMQAIDYMVELARSDEYRLDMEFAPGDLQLLNNYTALHWRTEFTDGAAPDHKRLLLRLWLKAADARPVDPEMAAGYITGARTGTPKDRAAAHA